MINPPIDVICKPSWQHHSLPNGKCISLPDEAYYPLQGYGCALSHLEATKSDTLEEFWSSCFPKPALAKVHDSDLHNCKATLTSKPKVDTYS